MSTPKVIAGLLNCDLPTATRIESVMYRYVMPGWSEASAESLRADLRIAADAAGILILPLDGDAEAHDASDRAPMPRP
ncbi:MAG: hypothetical protein EPN79_11775 [Burkholderiaceae bacterium]|nr:MAG: hypothetical protein EPN79_11775 [Burkholderiaceae bacterium]TBR76664.1 MAG: hypothetical protein EPN64_05290 [Burkholderiaceae bacterium]